MNKTETEGVENTPESVSPYYIEKRTSDDGIDSYRMKLHEDTHLWVYTSNNDTVKFFDRNISVWTNERTILSVIVNAVRKLKITSYFTAFKTKMKHYKLL